MEICGEDTEEMRYVTDQATYLDLNEGLLAHNDPLEQQY